MRRDEGVLNVPSLISWTRLPMAMAFPFVVHKPAAALSLLAAAGASDVLDGFLARRFGCVTSVGAALDPATDKAFVLSAIASLVAARKLPLSSVLLLSTREIGEAPLVLLYALHPRLRDCKVEARMANVAGKITTVLQFATVALAAMGSKHTKKALYATAAAGTVAAVSYLARALGTSKVEPTR